MTATFARFGNDLHAGRRIVPIVTRRRTWYLISIIAIVLLAGLSALRGPNLGIEFTGGSEFQVAGVANTEQDSARDVVRDHLPENEPKITVLGKNTLRVQTEQLDATETAALAEDLAVAYDVSPEAISTSYIGPVWSGDVTEKMARGVIVFLALVAGMMALYFRNLKASLAAMSALFHDMLVTIGVYLTVGFEITPGTVIGFLTVMGYSLYDTIVVFDKVRENTAGLTGQYRTTYSDQVELAANQTLVRSINTSVVALLPIGSILVIGAFLLGAGTLKDISLVLFIGIIAGTYSSIFLAPGFLVELRRREPEISAHTEQVLRDRSGESADRGGVSGRHRATLPQDDDGPAEHENADSEDHDDEEPTERGVAAAEDAVDDDAEGLLDVEESGDTADDGLRPERQQPRRTSRRRRGAAQRGRR